jgi:hypothetical protein
MKSYLLQIHSDVEPILLGPYQDDEQRDQAAREIKAKRGDRDGLFKLYATGKVEVLAFTCDDLEGQ